MKKIINKIIGNWKIFVDTPFGEEVFFLYIYDLEGTLKAEGKNEKGSISFSGQITSDDSIIMHGKTDYPIPCTVIIHLHIDELEKIFGKIYIDSYLEVKFFGEK